MVERIVSLSPSATSFIEAIGWEDRLVGVTNHDSVVSPSSGERVEQVGGWVTPDIERVNELNPDIVVTTDALQRDIQSTLREHGHTVFHTEPTTIHQAKETMRSLGRELGADTVTEELLSEMDERFKNVARFVGDKEEPVVYCEEWGNPPMAGGNWVPEIVINAGGTYPFVEPGERSREVSVEQVVDANPELVVLHHCGMGKDVPIDTVQSRWGLDTETIVVNDSWFNQPSPNLVFGVELLASVLHNYNAPPQKWDVSQK